MTTRLAVELHGIVIASLGGDHRTVDFTPFADGLLGVVDDPTLALIRRWIIDFLDD